MDEVPQQNIKLDDEGFPKENEFYLPILYIINEEDSTEEEVIENLKIYFSLSDEQVNLKAKPKKNRNSNYGQKSRLESNAHFAIEELQRLNYIKIENKIYSMEHKGKYILSNNIADLSRTKLEKIAGRLDLIDSLSFLSKLNLDMSFLHLTSTGKNKSIMDATTHFRNFLKRNNLHDYDSQEFGPDYKEFISSHLVLNNQIIDFKSSVYRSKTRGDPRVWFNEVDKKLLKAGSLFLVCSINKELYVFNLSVDFTKYSFFKNMGKPFEVLYGESLKYFNENSKILIEGFNELNNRRYILINDDCPNINFILNEEKCFEMCEDIKFKVFNESDFQEEKYFNNILFNLFSNDLDDMDVINEFKKNYFSDELRLKLSNNILNKNLKIELDHLNGLLKIVDNEAKENILTFNLENLLSNSEDDFILLYKTTTTRNDENYIFFNKFAYCSKPNFSLLSFFILDADIYSNLNIATELIFDITYEDNFQSCYLKLETSKEFILKKFFDPQIYQLSSI